MAIQINGTAPTIWKKLTDCIKYQLKLTDVGSGGEIRALGYQLVDDVGNLLSEKDRFDPKNTDWFDIDITNAAIQQMYVRVPNAGTAGLVLQNGYINKFKLKIWEYVTDVNCVTTEVGLTNTYLTPVYNSALQWNEDNAINNANHKFNSKSGIVELCKSGYDFLTVFQIAGNGLLIDIKYFKDDSQVGTLSYGNLSSGVDKVFTLKIPLNQYPTANRIEVVKDSVLIYKIGLFACNEETLKLIYLDPRGGWNGLCFSTNSISLRTNQTEICSSGGCYDVSQKESYQKFGKEVINKETYQLHEGTYEFKHTDIDYIKRFFASSSHFIALPDKDGNDQFVKFIIESADYALFEDNALIVNVQGYVAPKFNNNPAIILEQV